MTTENEALDNECSNDQVLTFTVSGEFFGINIAEIKEIVEHINITPVPLSSGFIEGVINLRGDVVPVVNLAKRFGLAVSPITKRTSIIIVEVIEADQPIDIGVMVDEVRSVIIFNADDLSSPPSFGTSINAEFISHVGAANNRFLPIINIERVLSIEELSEIDDKQLNNPNATNKASAGLEPSPNL